MEKLYNHEGQEKVLLSRAGLYGGNKRYRNRSFVMNRRHKEENMFLSEPSVVDVPRLSCGYGGDLCKMTEELSVGRSF